MIRRVRRQLRTAKAPPRTVPTIPTFRNDDHTAIGSPAVMLTGIISPWQDNAASAPISRNRAGNTERRQLLGYAAGPAGPSSVPETGSAMRATPPAPGYRSKPHQPKITTHTVRRGEIRRRETR